MTEPDTRERESAEAGVRAEKHGERAKVIAAWLALAIIWGSTFLTIRVGLTAFPPFRMAGIRFLTAGILLGIAAKARGVPFPTERRPLGRIAIIALFVLVLGNGGIMWAARLVPSGVTGLLASTGPLMIGILSLAGPKAERLRPRGWAGLAVGMLGLAILVQPGILGLGSLVPPKGGAHVPGVAALAFLGSVFCTGTGVLYIRHRAPKCDPMAGTALEMGMAGALLLVIGFLTEPALCGPLTPAVLLSLAYLTVLGSCVAFTCQFYLFSHVPAAKATTYAYVNPVIAMLLGWAVLKEPLSAPMLLGAALTLAGVVLTNAGGGA